MENKKKNHKSKHLTSHIATYPKSLHLYFRANVKANNRWQNYNPSQWVYKIGHYAMRYPVKKECNCEFYLKTYFDPQVQSSPFQTRCCSEDSGLLKRRVSQAKLACFKQHKAIFVGCLENQSSSVAQTCSEHNSTNARAHQVKFLLHFYIQTGKPH